MANSSFWAPGEVLAVPCHGLWHKPTRTEGNTGWVSQKTSVYFASFKSCLRVRLSSCSAFSLALADLKDSQIAVLSSGVPYRQAIHSFSS